MNNLKNTLEEGDKIEVYRNLHKKCFSVRHKGKVVGYLQDDEQLALANVTFVVQPAGRAKVLREKKKNVHAFVRGEYVGFKNNLIEGTSFPLDDLINSQVIFQCFNFSSVSYNPYKSDKFVVEEYEEPIERSTEVLIRGGKVLV